jgi:hypothetical protein
MGKKLQDTFDYSENSASKKPNSSLPLLSFFAAEVTTPYFFPYSSITTPTPELPIESINEPVLPYSGKGYIPTDENLITSRELLEIHLRLASVLSKSDWSLIDQLAFNKATRVGEDGKARQLRKSARLHRTQHPAPKTSKK